VRNTYLTDEGLETIEKSARKKENADTLLLVQILKEIRQVTALLRQGKRVKEDVNGENLF